MKALQLPVLLEPDARAAALDDPASGGNKQTLDGRPFESTWHRLPEDSCQGLLLLAVHASKLGGDIIYCKREIRCHMRSAMEHCSSLRTLAFRAFKKQGAYGSDLAVSLPPIWPCEEVAQRAAE